MARPKMEIDKEKWLKAIKDQGGMVTFVAKQLGISRNTVAKYRDEIDWVKEAFEDVEAETLDHANKTIQAAVKEDYKAAAWYLDRKGKDRGFGKEVKVDANVSQQAVIHLHLPDDGREDPAAADE
ncbi:hypothetical protein VN12_04330 [Pirellula sp. SH-Sr6A]|uniref:hypothetical protein n=1 Tax=Pirellula sp. SH-Sr6A TaxID=1632865 RepID=UPI00078E93FD|nr:hypothetical protein [Pirellula sp. SH-Sr6A]AMV31320.1 hypothetical protein VN12_04330 [Pirellula sp. SH-Sr6A]